MTRYLIPYAGSERVIPDYNSWDGVPPVTLLRAILRCQKCGHSLREIAVVLNESDERINLVMHLWLERKVQA